MKGKIELFVNKMPDFSGDINSENEVDDYIGNNFSKMAKELGIDLNDEKATDDAWNVYGELLNKRMGKQPDDEGGEAANIEDAIAEYVAAMPPYTGDKESEEAIDEYASEAFAKMADELGIDLNDAEATEQAWQVFNDALDKKTEQTDITSTGSTKEELDAAEDETLSDSREKRIAKMKRSWGKTRTQKLLEEEKEHDDPRAGGEVFGPGATVSDATMKNILSALTSHRF